MVMKNDVTVMRGDAVVAIYFTVEGKTGARVPPSPHVFCIL